MARMTTLLLLAFLAACSSEIVRPPLDGVIAGAPIAKGTAAPGLGYSIFPLPTSKTPTKINNRGWVLTAFSLLDRAGTEITLAPDLWPQGMNERTVVAQLNSLAHECPRSVLLDVRSGDVTDLERPETFDIAFAQAVSRAGLVVGWLGIRNGAPVCEGMFQQAVMWKDGEVVLLPALVGGEYSAAYAVNTAGLVVGVSGLHAVRWSSGTPMDVGPPDAPQAWAWDVNDAGQVVGYSIFPDPSSPFTVQRGFVWDAGHVRILATLGGHSSFARGINNRGLVVGSSQTPDGYEHAAVWTESGPVDLGTFGGARSGAVAINDGGDIVGWAEDASGDRRAAIWRRGAR